MKCRKCNKPYKTVDINIGEETLKLGPFPTCDCAVMEYDVIEKKKKIAKLLDQSNIYKARWDDTLKGFDWLPAYDKVKKIYVDYLKNLEKAHQLSSITLLTAMSGLRDEL